MVTAKINIKKICNELQIPKDDVIEILFNLGLELEYEKDDYMFFEVGHDRPDLFSTTGVLRYLKSYLEKPVKNLSINESNYIIKIPKKIPYRPYTVCIVCKNLKIDEDILQEFIYLQEKLHDTLGRHRRKFSIGFYKLDKIEFPVYYKELPIQEIKFIPLGFETPMSGKEILEKHPKGLQFKNLIPKDKAPVFVDNSNKILSLVPIINSADIGNIEVGDKNIFVDVTGNHLELIQKIANILNMLFIELGGETYKVYTIEEYSNVKYDLNFQYKDLKIDINKCNSLLGLNLKENEIFKLLKKADYRIKDPKNKIIQIPPYRIDIFSDVDIYEDIMKMYGINKISELFFEEATVGRRNKIDYLKNIIRDLLVGLGFTEVMTFALSDKNTQIKYIRDLKKEFHNNIELSNIKCGADTIRSKLFPELLKYLKYNKEFEKPIKIFEIGDVVNKDLQNEIRLAFLIYGETYTFTDIKQIIEYILRQIGTKNYKILRANYPWFIEGRSAKIEIDNKEIGFLGEIHPEVLFNFELEYPTVLAELQVKELIKKD